MMKPDHSEPDPSFFSYVEGSLAQHMERRIEHTLVELDPASNPYLQWILKGELGDVPPHALCAGNFDTIRDSVDRLEWHLSSLEDSLAHLDAAGIAPNKFNLSDIFEYMSPENYEALLEQLTRKTRRGGRLSYWNMMVPRRWPSSLGHHLRPQPSPAKPLFHNDKAPFYSDFVVKEAL